METVNNILYMISTSLLIPVIIILIFFFVKALLLIGQFYGIYINRIKFIKPFNEKINLASKKKLTDLKLENFIKKNTLCSKYLEKLIEINWQKIHTNKLLGDMETEIQKELEKTKILMRIGPMLGLMGTLIPMGPALVGLAAGNMDMMAKNMQIAFSTTVVGVFIGAVGFIINEIKKRWFIEDLKNLTYLTEISVYNRKQNYKYKNFRESKTAPINN